MRSFCILVSPLDAWWPHTRMLAEQGLCMHGVGEIQLVVLALLISRIDSHSLVFAHFLLQMYCSCLCMCV
jgi:hypothetical protein